MITVETRINASLATVWECFNQPKHVINWCFASNDWHAPRATGELKMGGQFTTRMEAKDGSFGFDLTGFYDEILTHKLVKYHLEDDRKVEVHFSAKDNQVHISEKFEPESQNPHDMQQMGWQMILNNFKKYVENL